VLVRVLTAAERPRDVDVGALLQVLTDDLRERSPSDDAVPFGALLGGARLVLPPLGGRHREIRDRSAAGGVLQLGGRSEEADQGHFVLGHVGSPFLGPSIGARKAKRRAPTPPGRAFSGRGP